MIVSFTVHVHIKPNGVEGEVIGQNLSNIIHKANDNREITGDTDAKVEFYSSAYSIHPSN